MEFKGICAAVVLAGHLGKRGDERRPYHGDRDGFRDWPVAAEGELHGERRRAVVRDRHAFELSGQRFGFAVILVQGALLGARAHWDAVGAGIRSPAGDLDVMDAGVASLHQALRQRPTPTGPAGRPEQRF